MTAVDVTTAGRRTPGPRPFQPAPSVQAEPASEPGAEDRSRWSVELALAALSAAGLVGFHRVFVGTHWVGPVIGTALGVQLVCRLTRRWVRSVLTAGLVDLLSIPVLTVWTVVPSSTRLGLPLSGTWRTVRVSLIGVGNRMDAATIPVRPVTSYLLLAVAGAGVVALAGSWTAFRLGRTLGATLPSLSVFVVCCALGTRAGRGSAVVAEVIAVAAFVLVARLADQRDASWFASRSTRAMSGTSRAAMPGIALAAVVALAVVASLPGADGHGPLGWRSPGEDSPRIVISPLVSLATRLLHQSTTPVFTARSAVPSYWRLTSLDYFDGSEWNARDTYQGIDTKLPGVVPAPRGARTVREHFTIQNLDSVWLPLAFTPEAVTGAGRVSYDPRSGSLLTAHQTSDHLAYTVTSLQYLGTLSPRELRLAPAVGRSSTLAPYLQLPSSIPPAVKKLAARIVSGKKTEYAKALALQNYFYGPSFTYSLHPPTDGAGSAALTTFLFQTRTGYCQQFAGAFAVLARAIGLPTRLAIGFTTGQAKGGTYQVTDADAHTWPEVWFPRYGWVPFEPTKGPPGAGFAIPGATAYTGDTAAAAAPTAARAAGHATTATTVAPGVTPAPTGATGASQAARARFSGGPGIGGLPGGGLGFTASPVTAPAPTHSRRSRAWAVLGVIVGALAVLVGSNELGRRLRWRRRRRRASARCGPGRHYGPDAVAVIWEEAAERLAWHGLRRRTAETPRQFAARVADQRRTNEELPLGSNLERLAELLAEAEFAAGPLPAKAVEEADRRAAQIGSVLARRRSRTERWVLRLDPRLAWHPRTVEASKAVWLDVTLG